MDIWGVLASIGISFAASFLFAYFLFWLDLYEKEPLLLLGGVFIWGVIVAAGGAFLINTFVGVGVFVVTGSEAATNLTTSAVVAPVIEEILKGFAVVLVFLVFRNEFDSILDGIVYAGVTALGFAASENAYYIYAYGFAEEGWQGFWSLAFIRLGLVGWQHPFYTAFIGIGLAAARLNRNVIVKLVAPALGFGAAVGAHALHNILASLFQGPGGMFFTTAFDWIGWLLMLGFILLAMLIERHKLKKYLKPELALGTLTKSQYENAGSVFKMTWERVKAVFSGTYLQTTRFYRSTAELALKQHLRDRLGEEKGSSQRIEALRNQVRELSKTL
jgi:RsiW-degrading membrane proteinase PrsW (M82 family)